MKILIVCHLLAMLVISANLHGQPIDCSKFRQGTFLLIGENLKLYIINRDNQFQVETYQKKNFKFIISWVDDCTYTLTPTKKAYKKNPDFKEIGVLTVNILEVREHSYIQSTKSQYSDLTFKAEIFKVEDLFSGLITKAKARGSSAVH